MNENKIDEVAQALALQYSNLEQRKETPTNSYSSQLLLDENRIIKKVGEEYAELLAAYVRQDNTNFLEEAQQCLWLIQTMAVSRNISNNDFFEALRYDK